EDAAALAAAAGADLAVAAEGQIVREGAAGDARSHAAALAAGVEQSAALCEAAAAVDRAAQGSVAVHSAVRHGQLHVVFVEDSAAQGTEVARRRVVEDAAVADRQKAVEVAEDAAARAEGPTGRVLRDLAVLHDQAAGEVDKNAAADATGEKAGAV